MARVKVAILGGGVAGVAAAFALSRTEALRRDVEVTVFQADDRLGGKGATARDPRRGWRIEEHGLHLWMGFYARAFGMMAECYAEVPGPWRTPEDAFARRHTVSFAVRDRPLHLTLPPRPGVPWDEGPQPGDRRRLAAWAVRDLPGLLRSLSTRPSDVRDLAVLARVIGRGLVHDVLAHGFEALDDVDLMAWLRRHGADRPEVYDAAPIRGMYNLAFAYPDGVAGPGRGALAAGPALRAMLRMLFGYRGAPLWELRAGMGDTVFAPLYRLLCARGVRFAFGHRVRALRTGGRAVDAVELDVHDGCRPALVRFGDHEVWGPPGPAGPIVRRVLRRGEDYDAVVLAIPAPAHGEIAADLVHASERFGAMVANTSSVATAACQLWLRPDRRRLGFRGPETVLTNAGGRFASYADLTGTAAYEGWPEQPGHVAYFCDVVPDDAEVPDAGEARAWADRDLVRLWPGAADASGRFDTKLLVHAVDDDPWRGQYFRINRAAHERYVLTVPGSVRWRLPPEDSTFDGLFLAGDWTRSSIDGGSVEAAVESGHRAGAAAARR